MEDDKDVDVLLNNCVKMKQIGMNFFFDFDVLVCGIFNFEIYGKDVNYFDLQEFDFMCIYSVCVFVLEKKFFLLFDNFEIGWGLNMMMLKSGIKFIIYKKFKIVIDDGIIEIKI